MLLQNITHFDDLASIRKFTETAESLDGGPFYTIFRKISDEQLAKLFNSLLRILHRCIRFPIYCFYDLRGSRASIFASLLNYVVINSENYGSPNHIDTKIARFFIILLRIYVPIYKFRIIWNFIAFYVESSETLIFILKSIYEEL
jgi:hypothetical protein